MAHPRTEPTPAPKPAPTPAPVTLCEQEAWRLRAALEVAIQSADDSIKTLDNERRKLAAGDPRNGHIDALRTQYIVARRETCNLLDLVERAREIAITPKSEAAR